MGSRFTRVGRWASELLARMIAARITFMAASIAYYGLVSLVSLLLLSVLLTNTLAGDLVAAALVTATDPWLTVQAQEAIQSTLADARGGVAFSIVGVVSLLWGISKIFRALEVAFAEIYDVGRDSLLERSYASAIVAFGTMGLAVAMTVFASVAFSLFRLPPLRILTPVWLAASLTVLFLPTYYVFSGSQLDAADVLPGAALAGFGWTAFQIAYQEYVAAFGNYLAYGILGSVLLLVSWLYYSGFILLVGAIVNDMLAGGDRQSPTEGAIWSSPLPWRRE